MFQDKSHDEIDNNWAAYREEGKINEIHPYGICIDPEFFSQPGAHTKSLLLKPSSYCIDHKFKDKSFSKSL